MFKTVWERYFLKQFFLVVCVFIFCFYGLYVLIDYANRGSFYRSLHLGYGELTAYYVALFFQRLDILLPFGILIASIRVLTNLNQHRELIALLASGISMQRLLRPFLLACFACTLLLYINSQWILPKAYNKKHQLEDFHSGTLSKDERTLYQMELKDGSQLIFHRYDPISQKVESAYWIKSLDDIFAFTKLILTSPPQFQGIEHFKRSNQGILERLQDASLDIELKDFEFEEVALEESLLIPQEMAISSLWSKFLHGSRVESDFAIQIQSALVFRMVLPWLCVLVFIGIAPFCVRYQRQIPLFAIYVGGMLGTWIFYLLSNAALVLAENQVISIFWGLLIPFISAAVFLSWRYSKVY